VKNQDVFLKDVISFTLMPSPNVIDNQIGNDLATYLNDVLPYCESGKFAIGYFFISGLNVILKNVKHLKELRLLISNTTDQQTAETLVQAFKRLEEAKETLEPDKYQNQTKIKEVIDITKNNLRESVEKMKQDDSDEDVVQSFLSLTSPEKKIIKVRVVTSEKLHAKAYLLKLKESGTTKILRHNGYGIVGSSNLSVAGLKHSSELNLVTTNNEDYQHLSDWFDMLWKDAVEFTDDFNYILNNSWAAKTFDPHDIYVKAMYHEIKERLGEEKGELVNPFGTVGPHLYEFQLRAVHQAVNLLSKYRGMIIADVVGLGKTFVGAGILKILQMSEGITPLIVCPPVLEDMWRETMNKYEIHASFLSRGKLSQNDYELVKDFTLRNNSLVLIDESHHFRNDSSNQYKNLKQYLDQDEDKKVILLTATPLGTSLRDVFNQIRLFHKTDETNIPVGTTSLKQFEKGVVEKTYDLRDFLKYIMIRRTRKYVLDTYGELDTKTNRKFIRDRKTKTQIFFPDRELKTLTYDVQKVYNQKYDSILDLLRKDYLTLARYGLGKYIKDEKMNSKTVYKTLYANGPALIGLIRKLLLKRMESSISSFKVTLDKLIFINKIFVKSIEDKMIPSGDLAQKILYESADDFDFDDVFNIDRNKSIAENIQGVLNQLRSSNSFFNIDDFHYKVLKEDISKDIETLETIYKFVNESDMNEDDKFSQLVNIIKKNQGEKILIFSEYSDTARYVTKRLKLMFPKMEDEIEVMDSYVGSTKTQNKIVNRFAPIANKVFLEGPMINPLQILVSTDIMSEGTNLQDAGIIINYDIHWNFVRLIQRAGRIDRIGQERETIKIFSFLPAPKIEVDLGLHNRVRNCIDDYMRIIGDDNRVLEESERLNDKAMYAIYEKEDAMSLDSEEDLLQVDKLETNLTKIQKMDDAYYRFILDMQDGGRTGTKKQSSDLKNDIIVAAMQAGQFKKYYKIDMNNDIKEITWKEMENFLREEKNTESIALPKKYNEYIQKIREVFEKEVKQNKAKLISPAMGNEQIWLLETLRKIHESSNMKEVNAEIEYLIDIFTKKITNIWLKRDIRRLRTNYKNKEISDSQIIQELLDLLPTYTFELIKQHSFEVAGYEDVPRILYSKYVKIT